MDATNIFPDRFRSKIKVDPGGCWLWQAHVGQNGYGQYWNGERVVGAHSFAFEAAHGPLAKGMEPDHLCRVRHCVNPDHLEAVTRRENLLRGNTIPAANAAKTTCHRGHPLSDDNLYTYPRGNRGCRVCRAAANSAWAVKNRLRRRAIDRACYARKVGGS